MTRRLRRVSACKTSGGASPWRRASLVPSRTSAQVARGSRARRLIAPVVVSPEMPALMIVTSGHAWRRISAHEPRSSVIESPSAMTVEPGANA
jgi:hypothetical protein